MNAPKAFSNYNQLLAKMQERGMELGERDAALNALKRIGYYRLSGYSYPYRAVSLSEGDEHTTLLEEFVEGTTLQEILSLYRFDERLRAVLLEGLQIVETALGAFVAHALGKKDPLAHLDASHLNSTACSRPGRSPGSTAYEDWLRRYADLTPGSDREEYVKHHEQNYDGKIPIWAAVQFLDFGSLTWLFDFLRLDERNSVASQMGLKKKAPDLLHSWLLAVGALRNHCAHGNRVWNRTVYRPPGRLSPDSVGEQLHHLHDLEEAKLNRLYPLAALIAYMVITVSPSSDWPSTFKTQIKKLEKQTRFRPEHAMGFPEAWEKESLWNGG